MKKRLIMSLLIGALTITSAMPVLAVPRRMEDGTVFDAQYYGANNPDVAAVFGTEEAALYTHYMMNGKYEGRKPCEDGAVPEGETLAAYINSITIETQESIKSTDYSRYDYYAEVSPISHFFDNMGNLNVVYDGQNDFYITVLDSNGAVINTIKITKRYPLLGGVAYADNHYYVVYGKNNETNDGNQVVMSISKYDIMGNCLAEVTYTGNETCPYDGIKWGTKMPFDAGNCDIIIKNNVLVCSYARQMYSGHQSNHVLYVNINEMKKLPTAPSYTSHSFDQRVIVTSDGSYLFADHGDAYERGFNITKIAPRETAIWNNGEFTSFHFREGANRDHGYNETYAQLGDITETSVGYVLAASSEETLSRDVAPTNTSYAGYSEARNLFIQIFKKDFDKRSGADCFAVAGNVRVAQGTPIPNPLTQMWLPEDAVDYGVIWLTDYEDSYYCASPKMVVTNDDRIVLLWEKYAYHSSAWYGDEFVDSYIMILKNDGTILQNATSLNGKRLDANEDILYKDNCLYWATSVENEWSKIQVNRLYLDLYTTVKK